MSDEIKLGDSNDSYDFVLSCDQSFLRPDEEVEITLTLSSDIPYKIYNISAQLAIGPGAAFKDGSVTIDGVSYPDIRVTTQFSIPKDLEVGGDPIVVKFKIIMDEDAYDPFFTSGSVYFTMVEVETSGVTNVLNLDVVNNKIAVTKNANKTAVISGQTLEYSFTLYNEGNMEHTNVIFTDQIPTGTTFVDGSVKVNGTTYPDANPITGFSIPNISPDDYILVNFNVSVD